jgi:hypothetical protein
VNTTLIVETALAVAAIDPVTRCYLAISKDRAARAKARREAAPAKFTTLAELFPPGPETTAAPAADLTPAGAAGQSDGSTPPAPVSVSASAPYGRDPVTGTVLRADGSNRLLDKLRAAGS